MTPKRKKVQDYIIEKMDKLAGKDNKKLYEDLFNSMSDKDFEDFMLKLKKGELHLVVVVPNDGKTRVTIENNYKLAKELGHEFFQRVIYKNDPNQPDFMTKNKYVCLYLPVRRAQQTIEKKISIPDHNLAINQLTGQVASDSRSAKITFPEQEVALAMGMKETLLELAKIRGGDMGAAKSMNDQLFKTGKATQAEANRYSTGVRSTDTLYRYFRAMHIQTTL